jgi:hypothetical protein
MCFWAEGSTNMVLDHVAAQASQVVTSGALECSSCYLNQFHDINASAATEFAQAVPPCPNGGCSQGSYPYALRCDSDAPVGGYYSSSGSGCATTDIDQGSTFTGGGIKIDASGVSGRAVTGFPRLSSFTVEELWSEAVTVDNRFGIQSQNCLGIKDLFLQDNLSGWYQYALGYTDGNIAPTGCVQIDGGALYSAPLTNPYFNGNLIENLSESASFAVPLNQTGPSGTYNQGNQNAAENQNEGSDFGADSSLRLAAGNGFHAWGAPDCLRKCLHSHRRNRPRWSGRTDASTGNCYC